MRIRIPLWIEYLILALCVIAGMAFWLLIPHKVIP